ncbi:MAG: aminoglycoside phosphotransferase, partial [Actinobacteria bacterium]|nr:aminoglycoside phosphotransferase [Actinomycetota bacterium]
MSFGYTIEDVTPAWLTEVLRADGVLAAEDRVTSAHARQIAMDTGFASLLYRVELTSERGPASIVVKLPSSEPAVREAMGAVGGYDR